MLYDIEHTAFSKWHNAVVHTEHLTQPAPQTVQVVKGRMDAGSKLPVVFLPGALTDTPSDHDCMQVLHSVHRCSNMLDSESNRLLMSSVFLMQSATAPAR